MAKELAAVDGTGKRVAHCSWKAGENKRLQLPSSIADFQGKRFKFLSRDSRTDFGSGGSQQRRGRVDLHGFRLAAHVQHEIDGDDLCNRNDNSVGHMRLEALFLRFQAVRAWSD